MQEGLAAQRARPDPTAEAAANSICQNTVDRSGRAVARLALGLDTTPPKMRSTESFTNDEKNQPYQRDAFKRADRNVAKMLQTRLRTRRPPRRAAR
jgi:hypothetical protein